MIKESGFGIIILIVLATFSLQKSKNIDMKSVEKNGMTVEWSFKSDRIHFNISAPTAGWVAIGFNEHTGIEKTYLIMGNVVNEVPNVVEYYTRAAGDYRPISELGCTEKVQSISGSDKGINTNLQFSLPCNADGNLQKNLKQGMEYNMLMAFSREDDFQHHSMMRTSIFIKL